jgi:hypothetical protein
MAQHTTETVQGVGAAPRKPAPCNHFPPHVRDALVQASQTPITTWHPQARILAIDTAIDRARASHPELFRKEI